MKILDKIRKALKEYRLVEEDDLILVAVSGGPDSLALLETLYQLQEEFNFRLHVVHLNHKIREEAVLEAEFVHDFALQRGIPADILEYDIPTLLEEEGGSLQDQARQVRYRLFDKVAEKIDADRIALGHHADDLAETVLMRFIRGAGLDGLHGFSAARDNIIRPLIYVSRQEIEEFCKNNCLDPCQDPSNKKPVYFRNKIRLELIPYLEKEYNPNLREQLAQLGHLLAEENQILKEYTQIAFEKVILKEEEDLLIFDLASILKKKPAIIRRIFRMGVEKIKGDKKDFYYDHYMQIQDLILEGDPGKLIHLPQKLILYRGYRELRFGKSEKVLKESLRNYTLLIPGEVYIEEIDLHIKAELKDGQVIKMGANQAALDADELGSKLTIRSRKPGDRFWPLGMAGQKKIKDFLIDEKVERYRRDLIPIITTSEGEIIWIAGLRVDDRFKIRSKTKKTCILTILEGGPKCEL